MWFKYLYLLKISFVFSVYTSGWTWVHLLSSVCFTENLMAKLVEWKSVNRNADYQYYSHNVNRHWEARCEPQSFSRQLIANGNWNSLSDRYWPFSCLFFIHFIQVQKWFVLYWVYYIICIIVYWCIIAIFCAYIQNFE